MLSGEFVEESLHRVNEKDIRRSLRTWHERYWAFWDQDTLFIFLCDPDVLEQSSDHGALVFVFRIKRQQDYLILVCFVIIINHACALAF